MITQARLREELIPARLDWITALRAPAIQALAAGDRPLQLSLFDRRDLAEITSPDYPCERLVVCRNPRLAPTDQARALKAPERAGKRNELSRLSASTRRPP